MRIKLVFTFLLIAVFVNAQTDCSNVLITYSKAEASLLEIFADLEEQYGIRFSYATQSIGGKKMAVDFQGELIGDVLEYLLEDIEMEYKILENNVLVRKSISYNEDNNESYQKSMHLRGQVTNSESSTELNYATVSISNSTIGTYTDAQGRFDIEVPEKYSDEILTIQYIGFESTEYMISELEDAFLIIPLNESQYAIDEITIVNREKSIIIGNSSNSLTLNRRQILSSTSGVMGKDFGRQLQLMPGISAHDDNSAEIKIRGSNSEETLMILDGMPIYSANHYYGIFSGVNTAYIDSVNLFKNTYPLEYGGKTAGLVELFSDSNQPTETTAIANIDFLTASGLVTVPMNSNSNLSIAGRSTITNVSNKKFNTVNSSRQEKQQVQNFKEKAKDQTSDPSFKFYDVNAKYQWTNQSNSLKFNFFKSADYVDNKYSIEISDDQKNQLNLDAIEDQSWSTTASSILWDSRLNKQLSWHTRAFYSRYINEESNTLQLNKRFDNGISITPINLKSQQDNELTDIGIDSYFDYKLKSQSIKFGLTSTQHNIDYSFKENDKIRIQGIESFFELGGYAGYKRQLGKKLNITAGLRAIYYSNIEEVKLSPRLSANFNLSNKVSFKAAYGLEQQVVRQLDYNYRNEPLQLWVAAGSNNIPILTSSNLMVGSTIKLGYFNLDVELYQKNKTGVLEYAVPTPSNPSNFGNQEREYSLFVGNGVTRGMDLILGSGYGQYDTYLSYTLSSSKQQFEEIFKNRLFPSENDRRHQFKWINSLTTGKLTWGLNAIFVSGLPYIDITNVQLNGNIRDNDPNTIRKRLRPYHRIDISTAYDFTIGSFKSNLSFSVFNLLNRNNVKYIQSVSTSTQVEGNQVPVNTILGTETNLLNRTVNLGLRVAF
ncbi:MAG: ferric enterobactin receptor [Saprospiraceae bacterium]|jgi:ferric enterobactin receptor